jgi:cyclic pyranopterin phosphate synthase
VTRRATRRPARGAAKLSHFDDAGGARMVDVGDKPETTREAVASGRVELARATADLVRQGLIGKGDVLAVARLAGIQGLKRTSDLIPLCHSIRITGVTIDFELGTDNIGIRAAVRALDRTGAEMEALTAVTVAALTIYDMCKSVDRGIRITSVQLESKSGGKSGEWRRGAGPMASKRRVR